MELHSLLYLMHKTGFDEKVDAILPSLGIRQPSCRQQHSPVGTSSHRVWFQRLHKDASMEPVPDHLGIDHRQRVYLARFGQSVEAVSFDDVAVLTDALAGRLGRPALALGRPCAGAPDDYLQYRRVLKLAAERLPTNETWYHPRTPTGARTALESARVTKRKVRLHFGSQETGAECLTGEPAEGYIQRRGDALLHPVLCASPDAGCAGVRIFDQAVIRVADLHGHCDLWCHPRFTPPQREVVTLLNGRARVLARSGVIAEFQDEHHAMRHLAAAAAPA